MRFILDTHVWIWWIAEPERLSEQAVQMIEASENQVFISTASAWELSIKYSLGKIKLPSNIEDFFMFIFPKCGFTTIRVEFIHALKVASLPHHHNDPFDRLLIAQAQIEKMPIITADKKFSKYDIEIILAQ